MFGAVIHHGGLLDSTAAAAAIEAAWGVAPRIQLSITGHHQHKKSHGIIRSCRQTDLTVTATAVEAAAKRDWLTASLFLWLSPLFAPQLTSQKICWLLGCFAESTRPTFFHWTMWWQNHPWYCCAIYNLTTNNFPGLKFERTCTIMRI